MQFLQAYAAPVECRQLRGQVAHNTRVQARTVHRAGNLDAGPRGRLVMSPSLATFPVIRNSGLLARAASHEVRPLQPTMGLAAAAGPAWYPPADSDGGSGHRADPAETT